MVPSRRTAMPTLGRTVVLGAGIGFLTSIVAVTGGVAVSGGGVASVGAGIMVAGFDGLPFGAVLGAMVTH